MSFRATASLSTVQKSTWFSNIKKLPLTSKHGNKDFYKGTGSLPGLGKKRQGRHSPRSKAPYILMDERMRMFVTPTSQANPDLRAYVSRAVDPGHPKHWPFADTKPEEHRVIRPMKERSIYSENGFDGYYYLQLARGREKGSIINPTEPTPCALLYTRGAITHARSRSLLPDAISKYLPGPNKSN